MPPNPYHLLAASFIFLHVLLVSADDSESLILLIFKNSLRNAAALYDWAPTGTPCGSARDGLKIRPWTGIRCSGGKVWGLKLENMALDGVIDVQTLTRLPNLRSVSFMGNNFGGRLPNFSKLSSLKAVYLSHNRFSGEIGEQTFAGMDSLKKLHLADNKLTGKIPVTLAELPRLIELVLDRNEFEGGIPDFSAERLKIFNVSHNKLSGEIPAGLHFFNDSLFSENEELCGGPLDPCTPKSSHTHGQKLTTGTLIIIIVAAVISSIALIALVVVIICLLCRMKDLRRPNKDTSTADLEQGGDQSQKLTFINQEETGKFDMSVLLNASAEHLGNGGGITSTYKAALSDGEIIVVKRFKRTKNITRADFNEHMRRLGRLDHENVLPIAAFHYKKEEKLLVTGFASNESLAAQIHRQSRPLDWPTRLNVVKGVALGLQYLHAELPPSLPPPPHGHLKSSNVLLDRKFKPLLTDYGLIPIVHSDLAHKHMMAYKSPEYKHRRKLTRKTDVWCLGILILEVLTGKPPGGGGGVDNLDLAKWIQLIVQSKMSSGDAAVFDRNMAAGSNSQAEMAKLLKVGLHCCQEKPEARPEIQEVADILDEIKDRDFEDEYYSTYSNEREIRASRESDDFQNINF